jgi:hypothetical protein
VSTSYNGISPTLEIDYNIPSPGLNPSLLPTTGVLMGPTEIDLTINGVYTTSSGILFGTETPDGTIDINVNFVSGGSTTGNAQIVISYV